MTLCVIPEVSFHILLPCVTEVNYKPNYTLHIVFFLWYRYNWLYSDKLIFCLFAAFQELSSNTKAAKRTCCWRTTLSCGLKSLWVYSVVMFVNEGNTLFPFSPFLWNDFLLVSKMAKQSQNAASLKIKICGKTDTFTHIHVCTTRKDMGTPQKKCIKL